MEQMNEDFVSNTLVETSARHDDVSEVQQARSSSLILVENNLKRLTIRAVKHRSLKRFVIATTKSDATIPARVEAERNTNRAVCENGLKRETGLSEKRLQTLAGQ